MTYRHDPINALVLAGGVNRIVLFKGYTPGYKSLLPFNGKTLIEYTLAALNNIDEIKKICIVGPSPEIRNTVERHESYEHVESGETLIENIEKGLRHFRDTANVLVIPSDLPLVTSGSIRHFLESCSGIETGYRANIFWSMVPEEKFVGAYRSVKKGFNRFRDISVCHGNLLLASQSVIGNQKFISRIERIYHARKSSISAALAVGPFTGLSYLFGVHLLRLLTISKFAAIASKSFGVGLVPVIVNDPDIAVDIDEPRDYAFILDELGRRKAA